MIGITRTSSIEIRCHDGIDADQATVTAITTSMLEDGYLGAPIVVLASDGQVMAVTGQHRLLAARAAELDEVPTIDIRDVFAAADQEFDPLWAEWDYPTPSQADFESILRELDSDVAEQYGIES